MPHRRKRRGLLIRRNKILAAHRATITANELGWTDYILSGRPYNTFRKGSLDHIMYNGGFQRARLFLGNIDRAAPPSPN